RARWFPEFIAGPIDDIVKQALSIKLADVSAGSDRIRHEIGKERPALGIDLFKRGQCFGFIGQLLASFRTNSKIGQGSAGAESGRSISVPAASLAWQASTRALSVPVPTILSSQSPLLMRSTRRTRTGAESREVPSGAPRPESARRSLPVCSVSRAA